MSCIFKRLILFRETKRMLLLTHSSRETMLWGWVHLLRADAGKMWASMNSSIQQQQHQKYFIDYQVKTWNMFQHSPWQKIAFSKKSTKQVVDNSVQKLPSEGVESTEDVGELLAALSWSHLTLPTLHQFGGDLAARIVLEERLSRLLQQWHGWLVVGGAPCVHEQKMWWIVYNGKKFCFTIRALFYD